MHKPWDLTVAVAPIYVNHPNSDPRIAASFDASVFISKYVSLNANFAAGKGFMQGGLGLIGIPLMAVFSGPGIYSESIEEFLLKFALIVLSFENINFHIPVTRNFEISPYISLLRIKYIEGGYGKGQDSGANFVSGSCLNIFVTDRFFISPFAEVTRDWGENGLWGVHAGIHFGFTFYLE